MSLHLHCQLQRVHSLQKKKKKEKDQGHIDQGDKIQTCHCSLVPRPGRYVSLIPRLSCMGNGQHGNETTFMWLRTQNGKRNSNLLVSSSWSTFGILGGPLPSYLRHMKNHTASNQREKTGKLLGTKPGVPGLSLPAGSPGFDCQLSTVFLLTYLVLPASRTKANSSDTKPVL